jgi:nucleoside-diphosphate-sugar epimerase
MIKKSYLVTGGSGFIGAALSRRLIEDGFNVRVLDDNSRGSLRRLNGLEDDYEFIRGDIRDPDSVSKACYGMDGVCHLAYVNGTEFFYSRPELVLDVGVNGMTNVINGCRAHGVGELVLASSSEVYQTPEVVPTPEDVPLTVPDPLNPRYSYGGGKIICELLALNFGRKDIADVKIFRPHNVYGPDMGWEHVLPQFVLRMMAAHADNPTGDLAFPIQGTGQETRAFAYIDDLVAGVRTMMDRGDHLGIYNIGTDEEVAIADVAAMVGKHFGRHINVIAGELQVGSTRRRCPDISKLGLLGYAPQTLLRDGLPVLAEWYVNHAALNPHEA